MVDQIITHSNECCENERVEFLSTGCIELNLALSQKAKDGGWGRGRIVNIVGDGSSGKTLLALETAAETFYNIKNKKSELFPVVKNINVVYWNREGVMDFPLEKMYGNSFVENVEWSDNCSTVEQWGRDVFRRLDAHKSGDCFLGILDSVDSLGTESGEERLDKSVKSDKPLDGSYGTGPERAKYFSGDFFNNLCKRMKDKDFTLILISQVREKIDRMMFGEKYYRCGGKALDFYTHQVAWLAQYQKLKKTWQGQDRIYGVRVAAKIKRNKTSVPYRDAKFPILFDYGIDNIGGICDFLYGPADKNVDFKGEQIKKSDLIVKAEGDNDVYNSLVQMMVKTWKEIEENTRIERKPKFRG
jgi:RecA/RadA recombinase